MSSGIHKNIKKIEVRNDRIPQDFLQNRSQHGHCLNTVSCAGVLADHRFAKNPSMEFVFRTSIFFYVFMNTRYISVIQIKIYSKLSANSSIVLIFSSFIVDLIVTTGSTISIFLNPSTIPFMIFAAIGAHDPFSINATLRF